MHQAIAAAIVVTRVPHLPEAMVVDDDRRVQIPVVVSGPRAQDGIVLVFRPRDRVARCRVVDGHQIRVDDPPVAFVPHVKQAVLFEDGHRRHVTLVVRAGRPERQNRTLVGYPFPGHKVSRTRESCLVARNSRPAGARVEQVVAPVSVHVRLAVGAVQNPRRVRLDVVPCAAGTGLKDR